MEGFKGTPGPWRYESETGCVVSDSEKNSYGGGFMLGCYERHWDGKLVSAAPELLEALQQLIYADCHSVRNSTFHIAALEKASAAITKALGQ